MTEILRPSCPRVDDTETIADMSCINHTITHVEYTPHLVARQTFHILGVVMDKLSRLLVVIVDAFPACGYPYITVGSRTYVGDIIGDQTMRILLVVPVISERVVSIIISVDSVALCAYPYNRLFGVVGQTVQFIARQSLSFCPILIVCIELQTVEPVESFLGGKPHIAAFVLGDRQYIIAGQSLVHTQLFDDKFACICRYARKQQ